MLNQPAGLPRVEMVFSVDPLQQARAATPPALTDLATTASPVVSEMTSSAVSQGDRSEVRHRQTASVGGPSERAVEAVVTTGAAAAVPPCRDDVDVAAGTEAKSARPEDGDGARRLVAAVMCTLNWNNDTRRDPLVIVAVVALLFILVGHNSPSPLTSLSLLGCAFCLLQLLLLQPSFNRCIAKFFKLSESDDGEKELDELRSQLQTILDDLKALRRDRPIAFMLAMIFGLCLLSCIDQLFGGVFALFLLALALALAPGVVKHKCAHKLSVQCAKVKNRLLKKSEQRDSQD